MGGILGTGRHMDIQAWLRGLGLVQYEAAFRDNGIDDKVLPSLTAEDLKDLGVTLVGHRRKLLDAIAALRAETGAIAPLASAADGKRDTAERRQVTVMFADLVGSTALAAGMDPEDLREVIAAYHRCASETVRRVGGFVSQYLGDGVLVYFGYPQAHEDDAERAVRASLDLIAAVAALKTHVALQTRVGVATGLVVVGDVVDAGGSQERGIIGETPNLAARLQGTAEPNTVVIDESTRRLLGNLFELQDLGARQLKGIDGAVRAWAVLKARLVESRFEAMHGSSLTALVGREEEVELLLRRWSRAKSGEGQVVLLSGEAGIGKSRLTAALLDRVAGEPHRRLRYFCSPQHTDSALYPFISQMERAAGLTHDDAPEARLDKLDALLAQTSTPTQDAALLAEMLSLANDGRHPTLDLVPQQRRQRTLEALGLRLEALTRSSPVLMVFEDVHWTDPTSLELLGWVVNRIRILRVLLLATFRPEFVPPWIGQPHVTALTINRLAERDVGAMIDRIGGNEFIPESIRQDIIERTDGIPLFIEEMTKAVLESDSQGEAARAVAGVPLPALSVPASLHASLMARLDRLGSAKETAQIGAAIGREFSHALLGAVASKPEPELASALDRLMAAGLLYRQGLPPHSSYLFNHALVQDAAYGTLLREPRRALHARIAETLEGHFAEIAENQPELLARHWTEAGSIEKAAGLWGKAGQRSLARSALVEGAEQLTRALDQLAHLPGTPTLRRQQIELQIALFDSLKWVKGFAAPETKAAVERAHLLIEQAETLGEPPEDPLPVLAVLWGYWFIAYCAFNGDDMRKLAAQFFILAEKHGATAPLIFGHRMMGITRVFTGEFASALAHFDQALRSYDPARHRPLAARFGHDSRVGPMAFRAFAHWLLGYPERALADADQALKVAREIGQAVDLMFALAIPSYTLILCKSYDAADARIDELLVLADEKIVPSRKAEGMNLKGSLLASRGRSRDAVKMLIAGITAWRSTGSTVWLPLLLSYLAKAYADIGQFGDALHTIADALTAVETTKESWCEAEILRVAGEIALGLPKPDLVQAEATFERALAVARKQQAKSFELRAAMSLARLWCDRGERDQARHLLAPVYGWFTEGHDTLDLQDAKALLGELDQ
jgi:class 3 adenylate cyclase/predicted ATPase